MAAAVAALRDAGATSHATAARLLGMWARRDQLSDSDVAAVLATFRRRGPRVVSEVAASPG